MTTKTITPKGWQIAELCTFIELAKDKFNPKKSKESYPCVELEHLAQKESRLLGTVDSALQLSVKTKFNIGDV